MSTEMEVFEKRIRTVLEKRTGCRISLQKVKKNNGLTLTGVCMMREGCNTAPNIYLEPYAELMENGSMDFDTVVEEILKKEEASRISDIDMGFFMDFGQVKDKLSFHVVNAERNGALLKEVPHRKFLDLAKVYDVIVEGGGIGKGSILIRNSHLKMWGITEEELDSAAGRTAGKNREAVLCPLDEMIQDILELLGDAEGQTGEGDLPVPADCGLYVGTNKDRHFGAGVMLYPGFLEDTAERLGSDLVLLPGSIHEVLIMTEEGMEMEQLRAMVKEVNRTQVTEEEYLSDQVYRYDRRRKCLVFTE